MPALFIYMKFENEIMKIKSRSLILLRGKERKYLARAFGKFSCKCGSTELGGLAGKNFGAKIKIGTEVFSCLKPSAMDILKFSKRGPQVMLPKDSAAIASITGCGAGWKVLDAGAGSGFNAIFLANLGCDVLAVEKDKNFFKVAEKNISAAKEILSLKIAVKNSSVEKFFRRNYFDLITLDLHGAEKFVKKSFASLRPGGWLAVYALQSEDLPKISSAAKKAFGSAKILEVLQREWQSQHFGKKTFTRPKTWMMGHSGFLIFGRKICFR